MISRTIILLIQLILYLLQAILLKNVIDLMLITEILVIIIVILSFFLICLDYSDNSFVIADSVIIGLTIGWLSIAFIVENYNIDSLLLLFIISNCIMISVIFIYDIIILKNGHNGIGQHDNSFIINKNSSFYNNNNSNNNNNNKVIQTKELAYKSIQSNSIATNLEISEDMTLNSVGEFDDNNNNNNNNSDSNLFSNLVIDSDGYCNNLQIFDGVRVNVKNLPVINPNIRHDMDWNDFDCVEHRVDSTSCHIFSAMWGEIPVILKLIKADCCKSPIVNSEFDMEVETLCRIQHQNIVKILGSGSKPRKFLCLELLSGGSLSHSLGLRVGANKKLTKRSFNYLETLYIARSLAQSLDYLHDKWHSSMHIIHRDLKPDNIGWKDGELKLFDFGLCACVKANKNKTDHYKLTGNTGTLRYMAPEVAMGKAYSKTVDTYSFAIIIWQILHGKVPFKNMGRKIYMEKVVLGGLRPLIDKKWPNEFHILLQKCWNNDKNKRPHFCDIINVIDELIAVEELKSNNVSRFSLTSIYLEFNLFATKYIIFVRVLLFIFYLVLLLLSGVLYKENNHHLYYEFDISYILLIIASTGLYNLILHNIIRISTSRNKPSQIMMGLELGQLTFNPIASHSNHNEHNNEVV